jgi:hypothetical protein
MSWRSKQFTSLLGGIGIQRAYYHCPTCHAGHVPCDETLGLADTHFTPAATEVICIAGLETSFAEASEVTLVKMCGLHVSESTVERTTEGIGERLGEQLAAKQTLGPEKHWEWERDAHGHTCGYISVDATGVRQQGAQGAKAEGRMAYVGMVYNPRGASETAQRKPERIARNVRYLAGLYGLDDIGLQLRREAAQVGIDEVEQQIALSDGGAGLEEFFRKNFPRAEHILDFWHAREYLVELAKTWFGETSEEGKRWLDERSHQLKHEGGAAVLQELETLGLERRGETARSQWQSVVTYFRNHHHKMDYPRYLANGWQIGSGQVESACNTVVNARLSGPGRRWGEPGSDAVCHLRALYRSEPSQWEHFWHSQPT